MAEPERIREYIDLDPQKLMQEIAADALAIDAASQELIEQIRRFEGGQGELGIKTRWRILMDRSLSAVEEGMREKAREEAGYPKPIPAQLKAKAYKVIEAEARLRAEQEDPALFAEHIQMEVEIQATRIFLSGKERSSSLRQSILSAQRRG